MERGGPDVREHDDDKRTGVSDVLAAQRDAAETGLDGLRIRKPGVEAAHAGGRSSEGRNGA